MQLDEFFKYEGPLLAEFRSPPRFAERLLWRKQTHAQYLSAVEIKPHEALHLNAFGVKIGPSPAADFPWELVMNDVYDEGLARQQEELAATADMVAQRKAMLGLLNLNAGEHVLDVGSGNGIFVREVLEIVGSNGHACGIDISEIMVGLAQNICPGAVFVKGDATDLPADDESYDVLTTSQLLCFVQDIPNALREFYRVLKPGGRMLILDTDWESLIWNCRNQTLMSRAIKLFTSPLVNLHTPRSLSRQITEAGFELLDRQSFSVINWKRDSDSYSEQCAGFIC